MSRLKILSAVCMLPLLIFAGLCWLLYYGVFAIVTRLKAWFQPLPKKREDILAFLYQTKEQQEQPVALTVKQQP